MQFRNPITYTFSVALALALFLGFLLSFPHLSAAAGETAVVAANAVNVRNGPGTTYGITTQVGQGDRLAVLDKSGDWYQVALTSGTRGWVASWLVNVEQAQPPAPAQNSGQVAVINGNYVNVRGGPATNYPIVTQVGYGERLPVLDNSGGWYQVALASGDRGWVAGWLVTTETTASPAPPPVSPSAPSGASGSQTGGKTATVTGSTVNVRSGPGTSNGIVGQVSQGDNLSILEQTGDWYHVTLSGGGDGWVAGWLVSVQSTTSPQPPVNPNGNGEVSRCGDRNTETQSGKALSLQTSDVSGKTSTIIVADTPFNYTSFSLSNPDRFVVDLKGVAVGDLPSSTEVNSKSLSRVRAGYYQKNPDITRLVFELTGGAQYVASLSGDQKTLTVQTYIPDMNTSYAGKIIAIDPGHGGPDPGALGSMGTREKDVTLDVAKRVGRLLEARGAKVVMARSGDQDVGLTERTDKANNAKADLFVSIHINSYTDPAIGGTTTYIYNGKVNTSQVAMIPESGRLARYVQAELVNKLGLRDIGVKDANFAVLRTSNMPAILCELAFISNPSEEKYMNTDIFRNAAAEAIVRGIGRYFSERRTA